MAKLYTLARIHPLVTHDNLQLPNAHQVSAGQSHPAFLRITCAHGRRTGEAARMLPSRSAGRGTRMSAPVWMQVYTVPPSLAIEIPTLASSTCVASSSAVTRRREELSRDAALSPAASCEEDTRRVLVVVLTCSVAICSRMLRNRHLTRPRAAGLIPPCIAVLLVSYRPCVESYI